MMESRRERAFNSIRQAKCPVLINVIAHIGSVMAEVLDERLQLNKIPPYDLYAHEEYVLTHLFI